MCLCLVAPASIAFWKMRSSTTVPVTIAGLVWTMSLVVVLHSPHVSSLKPYTFCFLAPLTAVNLISLSISHGVVS
jgi:hypothetical protein